MNMLRHIRRKLIFLAGDIRREQCLGGFAWGKYHHLIDFPEARDAQRYVDFGYVGLHRNRGDFSNIFLPGFMKHAWTFCDKDNIIEAVSEGVVPHDAFHALMSDYAVILKPLIPRSARREAVERMRRLAELRLPYDDKFEFDLEVEESLFADKETAYENMKKFNLGSTCSEGVALGFVGYRRELGLYRTKLGKRQVILPDAFMSTYFEVVWASKYTTPDNALMLGLHEEGCSLLREYWEKQ